MPPKIRSKPPRRGSGDRSLVSEVAAKLAALRLRAGITREQLALMLGTAPTNLAQMLAGKSNMTLETVERVATALGYRVEIRAVPLEDGPRKPAPGGRYARVRPASRTQARPKRSAGE